MGWSIGYDSNWKRDIGYGVPATCDHPGCGKEIDRGLGCICGGEPYGGDRGCGLYFCGQHATAWKGLCARCYPRRKKPFEPTPDLPIWIRHKLNHPSWKQWRDENPDQVAALKARLAQVSTLSAERTPERSETRTTARS